MGGWLPLSPSWKLKGREENDAAGFFRFGGGGWGDGWWPRD